jgi:transposase-like protein
MGRIRRTFDPSFKLKVCQRIEVGAQTIPEICKEYQLQRAIVESWFQLFVNGELEKKSGNREQELERELTKLNAKIGELTMQIDALKKLENLKREPRNENSFRITSSTLDQYKKPVKPLSLPPPATITVKRVNR